MMRLGPGCWGCLYFFSLELSISLSLSPLPLETYASNCFVFFEARGREGFRIDFAKCKIIIVKEVISISRCYVLRRQSGPGRNRRTLGGAGI